MMKDLVGKSFVIADDRYRIVDVQQLGRDALIYAEPVYAEWEQRLDHPAPLDKRTLSPHGGPARSPARTAFHYRDIAALLDSGAGSDRSTAVTGS